MSFPAPCAYIDESPAEFRRTAPSTSACFMEAGFKMSHLFSWGTVDASSVTAPATTGLATEVPLRLRHPPWILLPITSRPYATTSGFTLP